MANKYAVVDLFAGPGGLGEGFSAFRNDQHSHPFEIAFSVEKERSAHSTLKLRSFLRQFDSFPDQYFDFVNGRSREPDWATLFPLQWKEAEREALLLELGDDQAKEILDIRIDAVHQEFGGNTILIGGPPCQAYSIVGRSRNRGKANYVPKKDRRHFLYQEYIRILDRLRPAVFVMENVKGLLSSEIDGKKVFEQVLEDLASCGIEDGGYVLLPIAGSPDQHTLLPGSPKPSDFVICAEHYGVPQARHRVIVVGVRRDVYSGIATNWSHFRLRRSEAVTVRQVLSQMPRIRSGLNLADDSPSQWNIAMAAIARDLADLARRTQTLGGLERPARDVVRHFVKDATLLGRANGSKDGFTDNTSLLDDWLSDGRIDVLPNNETRGHMLSDLSRYMFSALYAGTYGVSPKAEQFPLDLAPNHQNWFSGKFSDRFRVQVWDFPSTTITSHISKDGHYFIHPDPTQCRSLTVREAARLQTFPDNYLFKGNRTEQYVQVGNAVPPYLALQIAESVHSLLSASDVSDNFPVALSAASA
jgi:DNA (cytosine-5)-methyltransferase 1